MSCQCASKLPFLEVFEHGKMRKHNLPLLTAFNRYRVSSNSCRRASLSKSAMVDFEFALLKGVEGNKTDGFSVSLRAVEIVDGVVTAPGEVDDVAGPVAK